MRKRILLAMLGIIAFTAPLGAAPGASAETLRDQTRVALSRIADGTWTDADLTLIRSQPELAPSSMTPGPATNGDTPAPSSPPTVGVWMMSISREVPLPGEGGLHQTAMPVAL